jgi:hypothetical protein
MLCVVGVYTGLTNELSIINLFYQGVYAILSIYNNYIVKGIVCRDNMIVVSLMCLYYNSLLCNWGFARLYLVW